MEFFEVNSYSEIELAEAFDGLFPKGFAGSDVVQELAPEGWENSPLVAVFHPSLEQCHAEAVRMRGNIQALRRPDDMRPVPPPPTLVEIAREYRDSPVEVEPEVRELVGRCLWDIFSDNHEVMDGEGRVLDLGSFRASGGFLADQLNREVGREAYDYLNFYMGTVWVGGRADLSPVYQMIFRRLRNGGLDWAYHFPRLYAVDLRGLKEALEDTGQPEWMDYSPSEAFAKEVEEKEREEALAEFRESLDEGHRQAIEEALHAPPPKTVCAYQAIHGELPRGWPPTP